MMQLGRNLRLLLLFGLTESIPSQKHQYLRKPGN